MDDQAARTYAIAFLGQERGDERAPTRTTMLHLGPDDDARTVAESLRRAEADRLGEPSLSAGLGGPRDAERSIQLTALHAEQAVRLGRALNGPGRVTTFADLGPYCFVLGRPTEEIRSFCRTILGPLAESAQHDELRTLEEFLRAHGSVNAVARALFLHRNTVRQRLKRIGELTGADLANADQRVQLYLAVLGQNALRELAS
ncbi:MAG TPA: helix-turn-helix domain-containing protein [Candidatus Limnocylindria bacterium]|nr:helix-turn-helix domain-containing protein [Candidatus Limnocylindria bacterium]